jgi:hypothetical protein
MINNTKDEAPQNSFFQHFGKQALFCNINILQKKKGMQNYSIGGLNKVSSQISFEVK